jgi:hypothetical protein
LQPQSATRPAAIRSPWNLRGANKKQTVTTLILLEKLCTEKEKIRHGF